MDFYLCVLACVDSRNYIHGLQTCTRQSSTDHQTERRLFLKYPLRNRIRSCRLYYNREIGQINNLHDDDIVLANSNFLVVPRIRCESRSYPVFIGERGNDWI